MREYRALFLLVFVIGLAGSTILGAPRAHAQDAPLVEEYVTGEVFCPAIKPVLDIPRVWDLEHFDADGNGILSDDESAAADAAHEARRRNRLLLLCDADKDGTLNAQEQEDAITRIQTWCTRWWQQHLERWDADGDGTVSMEEEAAHLADRQARRRTGYEEYLAEYDQTGDGLVTRAERQAVAAERAAAEARRRTEEAARWQRIVKEFDFDNDGKLSGMEYAAAEAAFNRQDSLPPD